MFDANIPRTSVNKITTQLRKRWKYELSDAFYRQTIWAVVMEQSLKFKVFREISFGCVQKFQIAHWILLKTILSVITNFPSPGRAKPVFRFNPQVMACNMSTAGNLHLCDLIARVKDIIISAKWTEWTGEYNVIIVSVRLSFCAHPEAMRKEVRLGPLRVRRSSWPGIEPVTSQSISPPLYHWRHHGTIYVMAFIGLHILKGEVSFIRYSAQYNKQYKIKTIQ